MPQYIAHTAIQEICRIVTALMLTFAAAGAQCGANAHTDFLPAAKHLSAVDKSVHSGVIHL